MKAILFFLTIIISVSIYLALPQYMDLYKDLIIIPLGLLAVNFMVSE